MSFGLDPSIILSGLPKPPQEASFNDTLRTLADLAEGRTRQQHTQLQLSDLFRKQDQERKLSDIFRANAGAMPAGLPRDLASIGMGQQAMAWQDQEAQMAEKKAQERKQRLELETAYRRHIGEKFGNVTDQASLDAVRQELASSGDPFLATYVKTKVPETYTPEGIKPIAEQAISPEARARIAAMGGRSGTRLVTGEDGQQYVVNSREPDAPATVIRDAQGNPIKGRAPSVPTMLVTGEGGAQYFADPRQPNAPAKPVRDESGAPIVKPPPAKAGKALNVADRNRLEQLAGQTQAFEDLRTRFKDSFAGKGPLGDVTVKTKQSLGSLASEADQEEGAFWADFNRFVDLPERNKTFGASLTATEKASWERAKNIKPGASAKIVREQLAKMQEIAAGSMRRRGRSLAKDGYSADAIEELTGPLGESMGASGGGPASGKAVDHFLVSPDKKRRVPIYSDGSEGPEEAVP